MDILVIRGISKASFRFEYMYPNAKEYLGECKRQTVSNPETGERFDVWINEKGDMLLASPIPVWGKNIKDFDL